jgi:cyclopropane-fatty-acyl-phospholipid synthase
MIERIPPKVARKISDRLLSLIAVGSLAVIEGGQRREYGVGAPTATVIVRDRRFWPQLLRGSIGLAEAYADGWIDSPDLVAMIRLAARNGGRLDQARRLATPVRIPLQQLRAALRPGTRNRSRKDISAHYDLGNELFSLMLDPTLSYSCAYFESPEMTLEQAQIAKLDRICERLELSASDHLLEIGTGWGALAVHAARTSGCRVTTTTISKEQYQYALQRVADAGLADRINVVMQDYRDLSGRYDKLVSVEMIEAVGWRHLGVFMKKCGELLESDGLMLLQAITIDDRSYELEKASRSFIKAYIFPGGTLPSLEVLSRYLAKKTDMQTLWLDDITSHYVETLHRWRRAFLANEEQLDELGYDLRFRKIWELYLAYCEAGFAERRINDVQMLLAKPGHRVTMPEQAAVLESLQATS